MNCSPLFDADASFSSLDDEELDTQLPPINELFYTMNNSHPINELLSTINNSPPINEVVFEPLDSERSRNVSLLGVTFGLLCRTWDRVTGSQSL